jgi:hypothetical protein
MLVRHAIALARRGLYVFPCLPGSKKPVPGSHGCRDATTGLALIERWWRENPDYNVAIATGAASGVFVLDADTDRADGEAELRKLEAQYGELPPTVEVITAHGRHLYFAWPDRLVRCSVSSLAPGLDIRGQGGYVLAPPSKHPDGGGCTYAWSVDSASSFASAPEWLLTRIAAPKRNGRGVSTPPSEWRELVSGGVSEGQRNDSLARLAGLLLCPRVNLDVVMVRDLLLSWNATHCQPPLDHAEVIAIVNSIAGREMKRRGIR